MYVERDWAHAVICRRTQMISRSVGSPVMAGTGAGKPARMVALSLISAVDMISCVVDTISVGVSLLDGCCLDG